jgi:putative addiction module component (TIGR02574 family)
MGSEARKILEAAMALPANEREAVAQELLASLEEPDRAVEEAWAAEITCRAERVLAGQSQGVPWETVKQEVRGVLSRK